MGQAVRIYTTQYCSYCRAAKALLARKGIAYQEIDVTEDDATRAWLVETTGQRTVPQIFVGEEAIGGYRELSALDSTGDLVKRLGGGE